jgi:hypothetical protein
MNIGDKLIEFIKGLMQPSITVFALLVGGYLVFGGKIPAGDAWWVVLAVFGFWFGKTVGLFGSGKNETASLTSTQNDLVSVIKQQQATIAYNSQDLAASVPLSAVQVIADAQKATVSSEPDMAATLNDIESAVDADLKADKNG